MTRDEFRAADRDAIAMAAGHRCSSPFCRRLTSRPRPGRRDAAFDFGRAAHITAAAPGGPRYDSAVSASQRSSAENGIWLCPTCADLVDRAPEWFTVETLRSWKELAELEAIRDARASSSALEDAIHALERAASELVELAAEEKRSLSGVSPLATDSELSDDERRDLWWQRSQELVAEHDATRMRYQRDVEPQVIDAVYAAGALLGADLTVEMDADLLGARTNALSKEALAARLSVLRARLRRA
jgi:hypothetical protein